MKQASQGKLVMPGHSSLPCADCVNLSAMPGIHVLAAFKQERRGWPGRSPAMTENESTRPDHESLTLLPLTERYNTPRQTIAGVHHVKACAVRSARGQARQGKGSRRVPEIGAAAGAGRTRNRDLVRDPGRPFVICDLRYVQ